MKKILQGAIRLYQMAVSPWLPPSCRFVPSCSEYWAQAIQTHGIFRGVVLGVRRLARCHPFCRGGVDLVPLQ